MNFDVCLTKYFVKLKIILDKIKALMFKNTLRQIHIKSRVCAYVCNIYMYMKLTLLDSAVH